MPTSALETWPRFLNLVERVPQPQRRSVLDVGPGHGKASVLLREYLNGPPNIIDAVEAWRPYVDDFDLLSLYDTVWIADVLAERWEGVRLEGSHEDGARLVDARPAQAADLLAGYGVVVMGDVLEHLPKPDARALLDRIPGWVVINTPVEFFDNPPDLPPTEAHVSHWTEDDWARMARTDEVLEVAGAWLVRLRPQ